MATAQTTPRAGAPKPGGWLRFAWFAIKSAVVFLGVVVVLVSFTPLVPWWAHKFSGPIENPHGDILIVLAAAGDSGDGILSYTSYLRSEYAIRAWREGWVRNVLVCGGSTGGTPTASAMVQFMESQGVPAAAIRAETSSTSTRESALFSKSLLDQMPGTKVLLTSDYHMYRARRTFEKAGIQVLARPFPDAIKRGSSISGRWPAFLDLCLESVKIAYYRFRGWS